MRPQPHPMPCAIGGRCGKITDRNVLIHAPQGRNANCPQLQRGGYMGCTNNKARPESKALMSMVPEKGVEPSTFSLRMREK